MLRKVLRHILSDAFGLEVRRCCNSHDARRVKLLGSQGIDIVLDIGANEGQYVQSISFGYKGKIVSFEPLSSAYVRLQENAKTDPLWKTFNQALGEYNGEVEINVSGNSVSSSILPIMTRHVECAPLSAYIAKERVRISTLDSVFENISEPEEQVFLKMDVQGFESKVLLGARKSLERIRGLQVECSLETLYSGQVLLPDILTDILSAGFTLMYIEPGFGDSTTGQLLQADITFFRGVKK